LSALRLKKNVEPLRIIIGKKKKNMKIMMTQLQIICKVI